MRFGILHSLIIFFAFVQLRCTEAPDKVEIKKLSFSNPTKFTFNIPLPELRDSVIKLFSIESQMNDPILQSIFIDRILKKANFPITFSAETANQAVFGKEHFKKPGTVNDVYLYPMGSYWYSPVYFHGHDPFLFSTSFAIQFTSISSMKTILTVIDIDPEIINGTQCCGSHGNYSRTESVKPTTFEEYTLILYLEEKLGVQNFEAFASSQTK